MDTKLNILFLEDSEIDADLIVRFLKKEKIDFNYSRIWQKNDFINALERSNPDLIISDQSMPQFSGMEAFRIVKNSKKNIPFIIITGTVAEKTLTEFAKEGIDDYILKENLLRLPSAIKHVLSTKKIEKLHQEIEIAHQNIKDSINYARIIQDAILPDIALLQNAFPESFVLYLPKDILSGDFYWFQAIEDTFLIAAGDCTGHGVPGALLAMMGNNFLNEAVNGKNIFQPAAVLERLNNQFMRNLKNGNSTSNDGMEIALCAIDLKNKNLIYSGANRPLVIIREKELIEIKPDKVAIGGGDNADKKYTNQTISIKTGDRIFLFSDGYADQFHFQTGKKIMKKRFKELLLNFAEKPLDEHKNIITNFFVEWQGDIGQVDDVLLIGIQI